MLFKAGVVAAAVGTAIAARPTNTSICDYYTTALLMNNTAANQMTLLTLVVNTAVIGNYTKPNVGIKVAGILAPGEYNGTAVNLLPYFDGGLASTNTGGSSGMSVNFLDDGGAAPLMMNKPANGTDSAQYTLLTHLYEYFGGLLGCTMMGTDAYPAYDGSNSMYSVHKFMDLSAAEVGYFIQQVAMSAASFGVATEDLTVVGTALNSLFGYKDSAPAVVIPTQPAALQAICIAADCPEAKNATTSGYDAAVEPSTAVSSLVPTMSSATGTATPAMTGSATNTASGGATGTSSVASASSTSTNGAAAVAINFAAVVGGVAALLL